MVEEREEQEEQARDRERPKKGPCVVCNATKASAWNGGPNGKKRKFPAREPRFELPAWCCKKPECMRQCGFILDPARTTALEQVKEVDKEVLSELISIRGTRCAPVANLFTVLLPSLPILPHPRHILPRLVSRYRASHCKSACELRRIYSVPHCR